MYFVGACTCQVARKYSNASSSYSPKTKRDRRTDGRTDGRKDGSRDSNCPYLLSGETIFLLTPKSPIYYLGKHLPFNHIVSDEALFNISKILKTSSSYSAKTKSDGRTFISPSSLVVIMYIGFKI